MKSKRNNSKKREKCHGLSKLKMVVTPGTDLFFEPNGFIKKFISKLARVTQICPPENLKRISVKREKRSWFIKSVTRFSHLKYRSQHKALHCGSQGRHDFRTVLYKKRVVQATSPKPNQSPIMLCLADRRLWCLCQ